MLMPVNSPLPLASSASAAAAAAKKSVNMLSLIFAVCSLTLLHPHSALAVSGDGSGEDGSAPAPEIESCLDLDSFLRCAADFWEGEDLSDRQFPRAISDVILRPNLSRTCPLARATALAVTSRFALELSYPLLRELPGSLLYGTKDIKLVTGRIRLEQDLKSFVTNLTLESSIYLGQSPANEFTHRFGAKLLHQLSLITELTSKLAQSSEESSSWPVAEGEQGTRLIRAAAQDSTWDEAFLPLRYNSGDVAAFWDASAAGVVIDMFRSFGSNMTFPDVFALVGVQELELRDCFFEVLDALEEQRTLGILAASWPRSSTLLALLRYGRLFGEFEDGSRDCVDDDLDLEVSLPDIPGAWYKFVLDMSQRLEKLGYWCFLGGSVRELIGPKGRYEHLFCRATRAKTLCPVSFLRADAETTPRNFAYCLAYERPVLCPLDSLERITRYGGCPAVPNIDLAAMTFGNDCILWMKGGLTINHLAYLKDVSQQLYSNGFLSMAPLWTQDICARLPMNTVGRFWVGDPDGAQVQQEYRATNSDSLTFKSCLPTAWGRENYHRCDVRESVLQQVRTSILDLRPPTQGGKPLVMTVLDGPSVCCPVGVSQKWIKDASGVDVLMICMTPDAGERTRENVLGSYEIDALRTLCPHPPDILVTDVLPSLAGTTAMLTAVEACWPTHFWMVNDVLQKDLQALKNAHLSGLIEEVSDFAQNNTVANDYIFPVWRILGSF